MHGGTIRVDKRSSDVGRHSRFAAVRDKRICRRTRWHDGFKNRRLLQGSAMAYVQEALGWLPRPEPQGDRLEGTTRQASREWSRQPRLNDPTRQKPVILFADDNADMRELCHGPSGLAVQVVQADNGKAGAGRSVSAAPRPGADRRDDAGYGRICAAGCPAAESGDPHSSSHHALRTGWRRGDASTASRPAPTII